MQPGNQLVSQSCTQILAPRPSVRPSVRQVCWLVTVHTHVVVTDRLVHRLVILPVFPVFPVCLSVSDCRRYGKVNAFVLSCGAPSVAPVSRKTKNPSESMGVGGARDLPAPYSFLTELAPVHGHPPMRMTVRRSVSRLPRKSCAADAGRPAALVKTPSIPPHPHATQRHGSTRGYVKY